MSPDPFRALDRIDPPDHWDDIARRAGTDDIDVDLDTVPGLRPRRRAVLLVAAAAAVVLVAGVTIAGVGDPDDEGVTAEATPSTTVAGLAGPCPFALDDPDLPTPTPVAVEEEDPLARVSDPEMVADSTWGRIGVDDTEVLIGVGAPVDEAPPTAVHVGGTSSGARQPDGTRLTGPTVVVVGFTTVADGGACPLVKVVVTVPMRPEDDVEAFVFADLDQASYVDPVRPLIERVRDAVTLTAAAPDDVVTDEPCAQLVDEDPPTTVTGTPTTFDGQQADGREFTVAVEGSDVLVLVDGENGAGGGSRPEGEGQWLFEPDDRGVGVLVGWLPPGTVLTGVVRPDGTAVSDGAVVWPEGELFALPDVGQAPGGSGEDEPWPVVHCSGADVQAILDERLDAAVALVEPDEELSEQIEREAEAFQERLACNADPATCPEPMSWEGRLVDGRTYRVEIEGTVVRAFADDQQVNPGVDTEVPDWPVGSDDGSASGVGFELSPNPDGGPQDWIIVGATPPGSTETFVRDAAGDEVDVATLTVSPDGRFYALHGLELDFMAVGDPWPIVHRMPDGAVVERP